MPVSLSKEILNMYSLGCSAFVFSIDHFNPDVKHQIIRNFIAKSLSQLQSVHLLHAESKILDCYILYRGMVDRLGHIYYLSRTQEFQLFDDWSFIKHYESNHKALSHEYYGKRIDQSLFSPSIDEKKRYQILKQAHCNWTRPNIENEFKLKDIDILYKFGYDRASKHVHPMANDGQMEYYLMCKNAPTQIIEHYQNHLEVVIQNSCLISFLTVQECLNASAYEWRGLCYNFLSDFQNTIVSKPNKFQDRLDAINASMQKNEPLCRIQ